MAAVQDITVETDFSEVDAFLNAEAAKSKELGLEPETTVEVLAMHRPSSAASSLHHPVLVNTSSSHRFPN